MPKFIIQKNLPNCGAFALAYYKWLTSGEPTEEEQESLVAHITQEILFNGDAPVPGLEQFCDPIKMISYLMDTLGIAKERIKFYSGGPGNIVDELLERMIGSEGEKARLDGWLADGLVVRSAAPREWTGYFITLCVGLSRRDLDSEAPLPMEQIANPGAMHYALVQRGDGGAMAINSWDGVPIPADDYISGTLLLKTGSDADDEQSHNLNRLQYINAGILIADE